MTGEIQSWTHENGFRWDHVPMAVARGGWLEAAGLDALAIAALTAEDTRPRVWTHADGVLVVLRGVNLNEGAEAEDMISARLWIEPGRVISVWLRPLRAMAQIRDLTVREPGTIRSAGAFVSRLAFALAETAGPVVSDLADRMDALELHSTDAPEALAGDAGGQADLADLRRVVIVLRRFFAPQRDAVLDLRALDAQWLSKRDRHRLTEVSDRITRLTEELDALAQRGLVIQDHLEAQQSNRMNRQMHLLTVVAALFLPLGFLTGLLGINVGGIPGAESSTGFWIVSAGMLVLAVALALWFRALGFLRRH